jgi:DNA helicase HerA-like ATPase
MGNSTDEQLARTRFYIGMFVLFPLPSMIAMGLMIFKKITDFHDPSFKAVMGAGALWGGYYFFRHPMALYDLSIIPFFGLVRLRQWTDTAYSLVAFVRSRAAESLYLSALLWWAYHVALVVLGGELKAPTMPKPRKERYRVSLDGDDVKKGVYLGAVGYGMSRNFYLNRDELVKHTALIGTTGSGKTTTIYNFARYAMLSGQALIIIDGKGEVDLARKIKIMSVFHERPFFLFSTSDRKSLGYNPLAVGNVTELADKIMSLTEWSEEHYKLSAQRFLQLLFRAFQIKGVEPNLINVVRYSNRAMLDGLLHGPPQAAEAEGKESGSAAPEAKNGVFDDIDLDNLAGKEKKPPPKKAKKAKPELSPQLLEIIASMEGIDKKAIDGLAGRLGVIAEGELGELLEKRPTGLLRLSDAIQNKGVVLFSLDSLTYPEQARLLGRLVIADIKSQISYHGRHRRGERVSLIFDEFNVFVSSGVVDLVNKSRAAGFEALLAFQSLADIDRLERGKEIRRQIIQNCNTLIVQRQNDPSDAEELANIIGTEETYQLTHQISDTGTTGLGSARNVKRYKHHPDEIKNLLVGQAIVKHHTNKGVKVDKIQIRVL